MVGEHTSRCYGHQLPPTLTGEQLKAAGQAQAAAAARAWYALAKHTIDHVLAPPLEPFTSEALTERIGLPRGAVGMNQNNAVGAAFSAAAKRGTIRKVEFTNAVRPTLHAATLMVWIGTGGCDTKMV